MKNLHCIFYVLDTAPDAKDRAVKNTESLPARGSSSSMRIYMVNNEVKKHIHLNEHYEITQVKTYMGKYEAE